MRHFGLTCRNHTNLRWHTKSVAWSPRPTADDPRAGIYNGRRNIFYSSHAEGPECPCKGDQLMLAPEETGIDETEVQS